MQLFEELHNLSFSTYADSHRHKGIRIVVGSLIAQELFTGSPQLGDFDLTEIKDFCLRHELHGLVPAATPEEIMNSRLHLVDDDTLYDTSTGGLELNMQLAETIRKLLVGARNMRKPSVTPIEKRRFKVALTFPGTHRAYVEQIHSVLLERFSVDDVFYDFKFQAELAGPNLDLKLRSVYRDQSDLLVAFIAKSYRESDWCGLEWRVIRELVIARSRDEHIMFIFLEQIEVEDFPDGLSVLDGRVSTEHHSVEEICEMINRRHQIIGSA